MRQAKRLDALMGHSGSLDGKNDEVCQVQLLIKNYRDKNIPLPTTISISCRCKRCMLYM